MTAPPPLSEAEIRQFMDGLNEENFFTRLSALDPGDPDHVEACESAPTLASVAASSKSLTVGAVRGTLIWYLDGRKGTASCPKTGAGRFSSSQGIASTIKSGTFDLILPKESRFECELRLNGGEASWKGSGAQKGLSNRDGKPWSGRFS